MMYPSNVKWHLTCWSNECVAVLIKLYNGWLANLKKAIHDHVPDSRLERMRWAQNVSRILIWDRFWRQIKLDTLTPDTCVMLLALYVTRFWQQLLMDSSEAQLVETLWNAAPSTWHRTCCPKMYDVTPKNVDVTGDPQPVKDTRYVWRTFDRTAHPLYC